MSNLEKGLYIVSTPIGNLEDISFRAKRILENVDIIICENPKHSLKLLNNLGIKKKLLSLHDYNENILIKKIEKYQMNYSLALISDAGSPLISDPGYNLVQDYIRKNLYITTIPGPSSIISSLQLSGLAVNSFKFYGFVPKNKKSIKNLIESLLDCYETSIFFISGKRLAEFLRILFSYNLDRNISICKELTKLNEYVFRGTLIKVIQQVNSNTNNLKGEFTVLVGGRKMNKMNNKTSINVTIKKQILKLLTKYSLTEVVKIVHKLTNISKKEIYKMTLKIKND